MCRFGAVLELALQTRSASNSHKSAYLCLPSPGIIGVHRPCPAQVLFNSEMSCLLKKSQAPLRFTALLLNTFRTGESCACRTRNRILALDPPTWCQLPFQASLPIGTACTSGARMLTQLGECPHCQYWVNSELSLKVGRDPRGSSPAFR